jgi:hypothetical protein
MAYYLLLHDNMLHSSIPSIISYTHQLSIKQHVIILGLLPVYIAFIIFGAALLGLYFGARIQNLLRKMINESTYMPSLNESSAEQPAD